MNITRKDLSATHAIISVTITKEDYAEKIEKILKDYKKQAVIPGFRKGMVPMSHIQKQYGDAVKYDEINKKVEESLNHYITNENLKLIGQPLPITTNEINIKDEEFKLDFEVGITPNFEIDFSKINVPLYKIVAEQEMINEQLENIQKHFGTKIVKETFETGNDVTGTITNEEKNINTKVDFNCKIFKNSSIESSLLGKKSGDVITFSSKDLFDNDHKLIDFLHVEHEIVHNLNVELTFTIIDILEIQKAELNQDLFNKMFGEGKINSIEELTEKTKEDIEQQYVSHAESYFCNEVEKELIEKTNLELPKDFLVKFIQFNSKNDITIEQATHELENSEKGFKFQLIENKLFTDNNLQITFDELKDFTAVQIKQQMMMYGMLDVDDNMLEETTMRILSKKEEVQRQSDQLKDKKVLAFYKDILKPTVKEVTVEQFIKEINNE